MLPRMLMRMVLLEPVALDSQNVIRWMAPPHYCPTGTTHRQYLALSKAWWSCLI